MVGALETDCCCKEKQKAGACALCGVDAARRNGGGGSLSRRRFNRRLSETQIEDLDNIHHATNPAVGMPRALTRECAAVTNRRFPSALTGESSVSLQNIADHGYGKLVLAEKDLAGNVSFEGG
jgi:hypothetical protein